LQYLWHGSFWTLLLIALWLALVPADQLPSSVSFWDKAEHAAGFAALGFLGLMAFPKHIGVLLLSLVLLGAGIEVAQWLTGWRQGDWQDWVADCVGLVMGGAFWYSVTILRIRTPQV
jgi:VanZ family protein